MMSLSPTGELIQVLDQGTPIHPHHHSPIVSLDKIIEIEMYFSRITPSVSFECLSLVDSVKRSYRKLSNKNKIPNLHGTNLNSLIFVNVTSIVISIQTPTTSLNESNK